jgi:hypothetical protein
MHSPEINVEDVSRGGSERITSRAAAPSARPAHAARHGGTGASRRYGKPAARCALAIGIALLLGSCNSGSQPNDQTIVAEIRAKFFEDATLKLRSIGVSSHQGAVTLTGTVKSHAERTKAETLSREVTGVTSVVNSLRYPGQTAGGGGPSSPGGGTGSPGGGNGTSGGGNPGSTGGSNGTSGAGDPIDQFLAKNPRSHPPSPLTGQGSIFESYGQQYAIEPRLIVAISGAETQFGTSNCHSTPVVNTRNAWNWFWCYADNTCGSDSCINSPFDSWASGIKTLSKFMRRNYLNKGYTTIPLIQSKYCVGPNCGPWGPNVTLFMEEMNGDPNNLALNVSP